MYVSFFISDKKYGYHMDSWIKGTLKIQFFLNQKVTKQEFRPGFHLHGFERVFVFWPPVEIIVSQKK